MSKPPVPSGFHALSEPIRIQIIELLQEGELCVGDLCQKLGMAQPKISFHLKTLKMSGLVTSESRGRWVYYRLNTEQFALLEEYLSEY